MATRSMMVATPTVGIGGGTVGIFAAARPREGGDSMDIHAVVGAPDTERAASIQLLEAAGIPVHYACAGESMVHPGNAYQADRISPPLPPDCHVWRIECDGPAFAGVDPSHITVIDHHRPGDPGYGRPPADFLPASSLGQVIALLAAAGRLPDWPRIDHSGTTLVSQPDTVRFSLLRADAQIGGGMWVVHDPSHRGDQPWAIAPRDHVLAAAADHCLEAAYRGRCPGVDPDTLMRWRVEQRAAHQGRPVEEVLADIDAARQRLREAADASMRVSGQYSRDYGHTFLATVRVGFHVVRRHGGWASEAEARDAVRDFRVADLRGESIPELPEAACREGIPFLATVRERGGREKVVLQAAPPDLVERFLAGEVVPGLVGYYGDPARGLAGGYVA